MHQFSDDLSFYTWQVCWETRLQNRGENSRTGVKELEWGIWEEEPKRYLLNLLHSMSQWDLRWDLWRPGKYVDHSFQNFNSYEERRRERGENKLFLRNKSFLLYRNWSSPGSSLFLLSCTHSPSKSGRVLPESQNSIRFSLVHSLQKSMSHPRNGFSRVFLVYCAMNSHYLSMIINFGV